MSARRERAPRNGAGGPLRLALLAAAASLAAGCALPGAEPGPGRLVAGLLWLALFTLASLGAGDVVTRVLRTGPRPALVAVPLRAALGAACLAACAGVLGALGALGRLPLAVVLVGFAGAGTLAARSLLPRFARAAGRPPPLPLALLLASGLLTFLVATVPSPFYDQFHYHLAFPERWLRDGSIRVFERQTYSYFPANAGLLHVYALAGPGPYGAQLLHWWLGALSAVAAGALARLAGGRRDAFWRAAALVTTIPSVVILSGWAGNDLAVAAFGAAGWLALLGARRRAQRPRAFAAGVLGGVAVGCKYLAAATVALPLAVGAALRGVTRARGAWRDAVVVTLLLAAGGVAAYAPWGARNARLTGDPMHPFLAARVATLAGGASEAATSAAGIAAPVDEGSRLRAILTLRAFDPKGDAGSVGALWLLAIPAWAVLAAVSRRRAASPVLLAGVVTGIVLWGQFHQLGRYLVPVLVVAAAGAGATWSRGVATLGRVGAHAVSALVLVLVAWGAPAAVGPLTAERLGIALGRGDANALLKRYVSYWPMIPVVNGSLPHDARILLVAESRILHLDRDVIVEDPFQRPLLVEHADREGSARAIAQRLGEAGVTHVLFNAHEADRIRRMTGREAYFEPRTDAGALALGAFFEMCLAVHAREGPVALYTLDETCEEPTAAPDRASP